VKQWAGMLRHWPLLVSRDAKGYSWAVKLYPLALHFYTRLATRDAKGFSRTVQLNPLALRLLS
jgi:hypothetical protein